MVDVQFYGNFDFLVSILQAVTFFSESGVLYSVTAAVFVSYFLIVAYNFFLNDKAANPLKELAIMVLLVLMFASPSMLRMDVKATSYNDIGRFEIVEDVPAIIMFPYWLGNRLSGNLIEEAKDQFSPVIASSLDTPTPLQTMLSIYSIDPAPSLIYGGATSGGGYDLRKSVINYMAECYEVEHQLTAEPTSSATQFRKAEVNSGLFENFTVDYNGISTTIYLEKGGSEFGTYMPCPDAYTAIEGELNNVSSDIRDTLENQGVRFDSLQSAVNIIRGNLTTGMSANELATGLFIQNLAAEGLLNTNTFATEIDYMIFQAKRERLMRKAAEKSVFESIQPHVWTFIEGFILMLGPLFFVLVAMGSKGMQHLTKYLTLMLFLGAWNYVDVYIRAYTFDATSTALASSEGFDPFSYNGIPYLIENVEAQLATAYSATTVAPMLVMVLLYGGVHSVMGAVRGLTDTSASGKMGSPDLFSAQNDGVRKFGNAQFVQNAMNGSQDFGYTDTPNSMVRSLNLSDSIQGGTSAAVSEMEQNAKAASQKFSEARSSAFSYISDNGSQMQLQSGESTSTVTAENLARIIQDSVGDSSKVSEASMSALAVEFAGALGLGAKFGFENQGKVGKPEAEESEKGEVSGGPSTEWKLGLGAILDLSGKLSDRSVDTLSQMDEESRAKLLQTVSGLSENLSFTDTDGRSNSYTESEREALQQQISNLYERAETVTDTQMDMSTYKNDLAGSEGLTSGQKIPIEELVDNDNVDALGVFTAMRSEGGETFDRMLQDRFGSTDYKEITETLAENADAQTDMYGNVKGGYLAAKFLETASSGFTKDVNDQANTLAGLSAGFGVVAESSPDPRWSQVSKELDERYNKTANVIGDINTNRDSVTGKIEDSKIAEKTTPLVSEIQRKKQPGIEKPLEVRDTEEKIEKAKSNARDKKATLDAESVKIITDVNAATKGTPREIGDRSIAYETLQGISAGMDYVDSLFSAGEGKKAVLADGMNTEADKAGFGLDISADGKDYSLLGVYNDSNGEYGIYASDNGDMRYRAAGSPYLERPTENTFNGANSVRDLARTGRFQAISDDGVEQLTNVQKANQAKPDPDAIAAVEGKDLDYTDSGTKAFNMKEGQTIDMMNDTYTLRGGINVDGEQYGQVFQNNSGDYAAFENGKMKFYGSTDPRSLYN